MAEEVIEALAVNVVELDEPILTEPVAVPDIEGVNVEVGVQVELTVRAAVEVVVPVHVEVRVSVRLTVDVAVRSPLPDGLAVIDEEGVVV